MATLWTSPIPSPPSPTPSSLFPLTATSSSSLPHFPLLLPYFSLSLLIPAFCSLLLQLLLLPSSRPASIPILCPPLTPITHPGSVFTPPCHIIAGQSWTPPTAGEPFSGSESEQCTWNIRVTHNCPGWPYTPLPTSGSGACSGLIPLTLVLRSSQFPL